MMGYFLPAKMLFYTCDTFIYTIIAGPLITILNAICKFTTFSAEPNMKTKGIAVTTSGHKQLNYKSIIHIVGEDPQVKLDRKIISVIEQADVIKCSSIAFPLLGTGKLNKITNLSV